MDISALNKLAEALDGAGYKIHGLTMTEPCPCNSLNGEIITLKISRKPKQGTGKILQLANPQTTLAEAHAEMQAALAAVSAAARETMGKLEELAALAEAGQRGQANKQAEA
jgi:hypothetical protein